MESFSLDINQIRHYGSLRILIEAKLRKIIPDVSDSIADKLRKLNPKFDHYEKKASMNFRLDVQELAHGKNPFKSQIDLDNFLKNYELLNNALNRIIEESRVGTTKQNVGSHKLSEDDSPTFGREAQVGNEPSGISLRNRPELSWIHLLLLLLVLALLSRLSLNGSQDSVETNQLVEETIEPTKGSSVLNSESRQDGSQSGTQGNPIWDEWNKAPTQNTSSKSATVRSLYPATTAQQQGVSVPPTGWDTEKPEGFTLPPPGTPGKSLYPSTEIQTEGVSVPPSGWNANESVKGSMSQ